MPNLRVVVGAALVAALVGSPLAASEKGPVTNLPMPRFVSLKSSEGNVRRGPSLSHRIDWVFKHRGMPLQIVAEHGHWRRVVDRDGASGWMHYTLLSGARSVLVDEDLTPLHSYADTESNVTAYLEIGVIGRLGKCEEAFCKVTVPGARGWIDRSKVWGIWPGETRD